MVPCPHRQSPTLPRGPRSQCWIFACWFLFAPDRQNQRSKRALSARTDGPAERADLLLQHGLLRSFAREPERCPDAFTDQLQNGFFISRSCEARSRFETSPRNPVILLAAVAAARKQIAGDTPAATELPRCRCSRCCWRRRLNQQKN